MCGLQGFALLSPAERDHLKVVLFGGVKVVDEELSVLLRYLNLLLLPT